MKLLAVAMMATNVGFLNCVSLSPPNPVPATVLQVHNCTRWLAESDGDQVVTPYHKAHHVHPKRHGGNPPKGTLTACYAGEDNSKKISMSRAITDDSVS